MPDPAPHSPTLSRRARIWGTLFLVFQVLFAVNSYGPQRIAGLHFLFDDPWVETHHAHSERGSSTVRFATSDSSGLEAFQRASFHETNPRYLEVMGGGVAVGDYDNDGWDDIFLTSLPAFADTSRASSSTLFRNQGDGSFEDVTVKAGLDGIDGYPQGALFFDYDNDGDQDLYVAAYEGGQLFRNDDGQFVDFDLDGHQDLVTSGGPIWKEKGTDTTETRNLFFRNTGDGHFTDVTATIGAPRADQTSRGLAILDANRDGRPDVVFANMDGDAPLLLENHPKTDHHWLKVDLQGVTSNRDGVGARVTVHRADSLRMMREVRAGESYQSTSTKDLFFGLGASSAARITVRWPSGTIDTLDSPSSNQTVTIREGSGQIQSPQSSPSVSIR